VKTLAGGDSPGQADGPAASSFFDTPCALVAAPNGELYVADTGNRRIRKLTPDGQVTTLPIRLDGEAEQGGPAGPTLDTPLGLALTHDGFLYVSEAGRGRVLQIAPDGTARVVAGAGGNGFAEGEGTNARFNRPSGLALDRRGALYVADSSNYVLRKLTPPGAEENDAPKDNRSQTTQGADAQNRAGATNEGSSPASGDEADWVLPRLSAGQLGVTEFPWPLDPQRQPHELVATMGEVRGSYDGEARHHLHAGVDVQGALGAIVRVVLDEKVSSPLPNWGFGGLNEGVGVGLMTYVHLRVGRDEKDEPLKDSPFQLLRDAEGKASRVRVKRGTRLRVGDPLGTVNRMYHVHLNFGPWGAEANPLQLPFVGFEDTTAPRIERDGIHVLNSAGERLTEKREGRLVVRGDVSIVVDAYDQNDRNLARRRLGLYRLGYQLLKEDGTPAQGFEQPRVNLVFDRLPAERDAVKLAYADSSGITVYGSASTRFLYVVTNRVARGRAEPGLWRANELPPGRYTLRIHAADFHGNEADEGRDLPIIVE
ncbi:MAG TPA: hypothetical protein VGV38_05050, partial [Pyrinomonadaceae bacterium]|nr:hypothetical protein [Pyrinomonadaceae bacterium]